MGKSNNNWVKQDSTHWLKLYPKRLRVYIIDQLDGSYAVLLNDHRGRELAKRVATKLKLAKKTADNMVNEYDGNVNWEL